MFLIRYFSPFVKPGENFTYYGWKSSMPYFFPWKHTRPPLKNQNSSDLGHFKQKIPKNAIFFCFWKKIIFFFHHTVSDLIRGELKGVNPLKYLTSQFWMVRRRSCKNQFWLKSESIMVCHLKGTFLGSNSTSQNRIGL